MTNGIQPRNVFPHVDDRVIEKWPEMAYNRAREINKGAEQDNYWHITSIKSKLAPDKVTIYLPDTKDWAAIVALRNRAGAERFDGAPA